LQGKKEEKASEKKQCLSEFKPRRVLWWWRWRKRHIH